MLVVSSICSLLNSPRDVDSAEPRLKQGFFPFLLFFLDRPTAGWNCSSCMWRGWGGRMMHDLCIYRSRWNTYSWNMIYIHQGSAPRAWTCTYVSTSTMITQNITLVIKHATHDMYTSKSVCRCLLCQSISGQMTCAVLQYADSTSFLHLALYMHALCQSNMLGPRHCIGQTPR